MGPRAVDVEPLTGPVRIGSVNLAGGRDADGSLVAGPALAEGLAELRADVVAVQEVDAGQARSGGVDQAAVLAGALGMTQWRFAATVVGTPGPAWRWRPAVPIGLRGPDEAGQEAQYGIALLSRRPVRRWHVLGMPAGRARLPVPVRGGGSSTVVWVPDEPRGAIAAELDGVTVIATHLSFGPLTAARQLRRIRAWARDLPGPTVLAGDLNLVGGAAELLSGGTCLVRGPTFPAARPRVQLDHLVSFGGLTAHDPEVRRLAVSDHRGVAVTVEPAG